MGILVLNYIDNIISIAPADVADSHFHKTISTLNSLGFVLNNSKNVPLISVAVCLGITFNIQIGVLQIPITKLQEVLSLCTVYLSQSNITKTNLQALIGSFMFLHKAIKPARLFVNHILTLLRDMGEAPQVAIDEGTHQDLRWFIACAHGVNGSVTIFKCLCPWLDIFVDASLQGLGGGGPLVPWYIGLHCLHDLGGASPILQSGRGSDSVLHTISRNIWLLQAALDCDLDFRHIPVHHNKVADLLSCWDAHPESEPLLASLLPSPPVWCPVPDT
jgi:hypothetical protein